MGNYQEALERAKKWWNRDSAPTSRKMLEEIFPELAAELKDERMFRELRQYLKEQGNKPEGLPNGSVSVHDMISWLEEQKRIFSRKLSLEKTNNTVEGLESPSVPYTIKTSCTANPRDCRNCIYGEYRNGGYMYPHVLCHKRKNMSKDPEVTGNEDGEYTEARYCDYYVPKEAAGSYREM